MRWVRALVAPYQDRCLRVQTLSAYGSGAAQIAQEVDLAADEVAQAATLNQEEAVCAA
jgi:predicted transposase YdaD